MKSIMLILVLISLILCSSVLQEAMAANVSTDNLPITAKKLNSFCGQKCAIRCSKAKLHKRCLKYCGICCRDCKCVPSGTYGNKSECVCYRDKKNSKGNPKCP